MTDNTALMSVGKFAFNLIGGHIIKRIKERKNCKLVFVNIPAGSGKTKLIESYNNEFKLDDNSDLYLLDIEHATLNDPKNASQVEGLMKLKQNDVVMYQSKLFELCKQYLDELVAHLNQLKNSKIIIVISSSRDMKKYLQIKKGLYLCPSKKLNETIKSKYPFLNYLNYCRNRLVDKDVKIYNTFDELFNIFCDELSIERKI